MTAKIKLKAASGGGSFSLQAPSNSVNTRVITLPDVADGTLLTSESSLDSAKLSPALSSGKFASYAIIADVKSSNADGGTFTSGAWRTRDLNTEISDVDGIVSISSNQFTLAAGSYLIVYDAIGYMCSSHQARLYNATTSSNVQHGQSQFTGTSVSNNVVGSVRITITGSTAFELQHRCNSTKTTNGFGIGATGALNWTGTSSTDGNIFSIVQIYKES